MKVFLALGAPSYVNWFPFNVELVDSVKEAELIVFEGGEDVDPICYDEPEHPRTYSNLQRDVNEIGIFEEAKSLNTPCLGVCRGSQFLSVVAGGRLVQDQPNPGPHLMKYEDASSELGYREILVTSTHHQAQFPFNLDKDEYKVIGWTNNMCSHHEDGEEKEMFPEKECEVVYYPKINALGIQPHPEMMISDYNRFNSNRKTVKAGYEESIKWFQDLLMKFLNKEL